MPRNSSSRDDNTTDDGASVDNTYDDDATPLPPPGGGGRSSSSGIGGSRGRGGIPALGRLFASCEVDPLGSVHRAWAVTVLLMTLFFVVSIVEAKHLHDAGTGASIALELASLWSAVLHLILAISGTFILKRFSTAFTIGSFLGLTVVISQQDLLLFAAFYHYKHGDVVYNVIFADLAFALFAILTFFSLILGHFRHYIIVK